MPPKTTVAEAKNFSLFMMRAVLDGRASELVDLVSVNWRR
jgi:pyruvate dehydrogenase (quinone)